MKRTNIYLDEAQTSSLDQLARQEGVSRAEIVRRLLDRALAAQHDDVARGLAAIDASFGIEADMPFVNRAKSERERHLERMWQLDAPDAEQ